MNINNEYKYFVYCMDAGLVVAGYEYKDDAIDCMAELNDECFYPQFRVYTAKHLMSINCNPYRTNNWTNPKFN